jgi:hypothetical protein
MANKKLYETKKVPVGHCACCDKSYGYEKEIHSGQIVAEYTDCTCHRRANEWEITKESLEFLDAIAPKKARKKPAV